MDFAFFLREEMVVISRAAAVVEILATTASSVEIPSLDEMVAGSGVLELFYYAQKSFLRNFFHLSKISSPTYHRLKTLLLDVIRDIIR